MAHSVSCGDDLDAVRILSNEFSVPYGVLRLQAAIAAPRSNAEAGHRVYAEAGQTIDGALQMLNAETSEYNVRTIDGIFVATETAIKDSENPLLVTVRDFEYNGTLDGLLHRLTKGVLDMGPPMYAFSNGDGQQLLELPLSINTEGQRSVAEILAEASRISGVNWHLTVMPNAKELVVDQASNEIRAASKRRLMVMLSRSSR
ncbi:MAG: hypothetical protein KJ626_07865 [Verrucomicrobia bacterium]|nr:hypothetical protein [Verrucomicrobiota bacterium]